MIKVEPINQDTFYWVKISNNYQLPGEYYYCKLAYSLPEASRAANDLVKIDALQGKNIWIESIQ